VGYFNVGPGVGFHNPHVDAHETGDYERIRYCTYVMDGQLGLLASARPKRHRLVLDETWARSAPTAVSWRRYVTR
jgi:hypothetical protein